MFGSKFFFTSESVIIVFGELYRQNISDPIVPFLSCLFHTFFLILIIEKKEVLFKRGVLNFYSFICTLFEYCIQDIIP